ncbi:unnamed protein product [Orchesella dallaii]|uniref:Vitelline membrane outer layer protein 1 n=1 Tax=Orchesella dallaii TaxID=48710 RepID=A0ABP1PV39_9HEXA
MNFIITFPIFLLISITCVASLDFSNESRFAFGGSGRTRMIKISHDFNKPTEGVKCPSNEFAIGASIRTSKVPDKNVTTITVIRLRCSDRIRGRSYTGAVQLGKYYENTTDWQEPKECTRGFVTGIQIYTKPKPREDSDELNKGDYVSGLRLLCQNGTVSNTSADTSNSVLFGTVDKHSKEVSNSCKYSTSLFAFAAKLQSVMTFYGGENLVPSDVFIECNYPRNPYIGCSIDLEFEPIANLDCSPYKELNYSLNALLENSSLGSEADKITCNYSKTTGVKLNTDITNLDDIVFAYNFSGMRVTSGDFIGYSAFLKTEEEDFKTEWKNVVGEDEITLDPETLYENFLMLKEQFENSTFEDANPRNTITFMNLAELRSRNIKKEVEDIIMTHVVRIEQLVGYCSVFKLYFPVVTKKIAGFVTYSSGKITRIIEFV